MLGVDAGGDGVGDLCLGGPDVLEEDGLAVLVVAERVGGEVVADVAGEGVGDDQRRAHEVVGADFGGDAAFEVAIAGEHGDGDEAVVFDGLARRRWAAGRSCRCRWCSRSRRSWKRSASRYCMRPALL